MEITNLKLNPDYFDQCIEIIEESFDYEKPYSFKKDFISLIKKENLENCFFILKDNIVVSTLFVLPKVLEYKEAKTPVLFLGGIAVHPDHRGKGLFKKLFNHIEDHFKTQSLYFLWSDLTGLYEKFSFYEFGIIQEVRSDPNNLKALNEKVDIKSIRDEHKKLKDEYIVAERSEDDWNTLNEHKSIQSYQRENGDRCFVHKGMDLQNIIHECYPLDMHNDTPFIKWNYLPNPEAKNLLYMGFVKINNLNSFNEFLSTISHEKLKLISKQEDFLTIHFENEDFELHEKVFLQGLWGPQYIQELSSIVPKILIFGFDAT